MARILQRHPGGDLMEVIAHAGQFFTSELFLNFGVDFDGFLLVPVLEYIPIFGEFRGEGH